jgi:uncharacterized membrane protein
MAWANGKLTISQGSMNDATMVNGVRIGSSPSFRHGHITSATLAPDEWLSRLINASCVIFAESGGVTNARCYNVDGPSGPTCSPTGPAGPRGIDRGLWQWNSRAWPTITDTAADDPVSATILAFLVSDGFSQWAPWSKSKGLVAGSTPRNTMVAAWKAAKPNDSANAEEMWGIPAAVAMVALNSATQGHGGATVDAVGTAAGAAVDAAQSAWGTLTDWTSALGKLLSTLISTSFWVRVGMALLGLGLIGIALALASGVNPSAVAKTAAKTALV